MSKRTAARPRYHHGDLKVALIEAATKLVSDKRVEDFSVADAARAAGVSSGAPYRHFTDKDDLLDHVAAAAFDRLTEITAAAMRTRPEGSVESIVAGGCAYVDFGADNPELFHLMWGATRPRGLISVAREHGQACHYAFIETFTGVLKAQGLAEMEPFAFSTPLWAMVHGFASLLIGPADRMPQDRAHIHAMVEAATRAYFAGMTANGAQGMPRTGPDAAPSPWICPAGDPTT